MDKVILEAYAKINLGLDVLGRRQNGYHDVKMIMQTVDLHDTLVMERTPEDGIAMTMEGGSQLVPLDEHNLIYKAILGVKEYVTEARVPGGLKIHLVKRIPVAAGLAGGSTDAAAAIKGMNALYELGLTLAQMQEIGVKIGADVPYCILGGTALSEGIGEILTTIDPPPTARLLLVKPRASVSTKEVYEALDALTNPSHPQIDALQLAMKQQDVMRMAELLGNILEQVTIPMHPEIDEIKEEMVSSGAIAALMSGSGPTIFGLFADDESRQRAAQRIEKRGDVEGVFFSAFKEIDG